MQKTKLRRSVLLSGMLAIYIALPLAGNPAGATDDFEERNRDLETAVSRRLGESGLSPQSRIGVLAPGGRVFLIGVAADGNERRLAERIARNTPGVRQVRNLLIVYDSTLRKSDARLRQDIQQELNRFQATAWGDIRVRVRNGTAALQGRVGTWQDMAEAIQAAFAAGARYVTTDLTVGSNGRARSSPGENRYEFRWAQSAEDRRLQHRIASQLTEAIPGGEGFYVLVQDGQAFVYGRVRNTLQREQAMEIAQDTESIERVRDRLIVAPEGWPRRDDSEIEEAIRSELRWNPFVDVGRIDVDVNDGIATLSGTVGSFGGLVVAVESAFDGGARSVRSWIRTERDPRVIIPPAEGGETAHRPIFRNMPTGESGERQL